MFDTVATLLKDEKKAIDELLSVLDSEDTILKEYLEKMKSDRLHFKDILVIHKKHTKARKTIMAAISEKIPKDKSIVEDITDCRMILAFTLDSIFRMMPEEFGKKIAEIDAKIDDLLNRSDIILKTLNKEALQDQKGKKLINEITFASNEENSEHARIKEIQSNSSETIQKISIAFTKFAKGLGGYISFIEKLEPSHLQNQEYLEGIKKYLDEEWEMEDHQFKIIKEAVEIDEEIVEKIETAVEKEKELTDYESRLIKNLENYMDSESGQELQERSSTLTDMMKR